MNLLAKIPHSRKNSRVNLKKEGGSTLGLPWNKRQDTIEIKFPTDRTQVTKRGILAKIARVYDPLGLVAPMTLSG